jgi:hypothetical protein
MRQRVRSHGAKSTIDNNHLRLVTLVLPSANNCAKDLGSINIAKTLPQSLGPVIAAFVMSAFHSYTLLIFSQQWQAICARRVFAAPGHVIPLG